MPSRKAGWRGYLAFTEQDATHVKAMASVPGEIFCPHGKFKFVPLVDTQAGAVSAAMKAPMVASMKAATEETDWCILEVTLTPEKALELIQGNILRRQTWLPEAGWRWYGEMQLSEAAAVKWTKITAQPTGLASWAEKTMIEKDLQHSGTCSGCRSVGVPMWLATKEYGHKRYCCKCWHAWCMDNATLSLYEAAAVRRSQQESDHQACVAVKAMKAMQAKKPNEAVLRSQQESDHQACVAVKAMKAMQAKKASSSQRMWHGGRFDDVYTKTGLKKKDIKSVVHCLGQIASAEVKKRGRFVVPGIVSLKLNKKPATKAITRMCRGTMQKISARPASNVLRASPAKSLIDACQ